MADPVQTPARGMRRGLRILLVVSLALNLAVVGVVAGSAFSGRWRDGPPRGFDIALGPLASALDRADRDAIRDQLRASSNGKPRTPREAMSDFREILTLLRSADFDPEVLEDLLIQQGSRSANLRDQAQSALVARIAQMTPEQRIALAGRMEQQLENRQPPPPRPSN